MLVILLDLVGRISQIFDKRIGENRESKRREKIQIDFFSLS